MIIMGPVTRLSDYAARRQALLQDRDLPARPFDRVTDLIVLGGLQEPTTSRLQAAIRRPRTAAKEPVCVISTPSRKVSDKANTSSPYADGPVEMLDSLGVISKSYDGHRITWNKGARFLRYERTRGGGYSISDAMPGQIRQFKMDIAAAAESDPNIKLFLERNQELKL